MTHPEITPLTATPETLAQLTTLLIETVAAGGSVSFMHPLPPHDAETFWTTSLAAAAEGRRILLGAWHGPVLAATVTLLLDLPPNQPHRAEIAKLMTRPAYRGRGLATALMHAAHAAARAHARTLLVLDTATEDGAAPLYERLGYTLTGEIPDFALKPHGGLTGTLIYFKRLPPRPPDPPRSHPHP
jgi:ribosomal protein S18 acetylase RimI-like enzyme